MSIEGGPIMQVHFVDGSKANPDANVAVYHSNRISKYLNSFSSLRSSSLREESELIFSIDENRHIHFISKRRFFRLSNIKTEKEFVEEGTIELEWSVNTIKIRNLSKLSNNTKYKYNYLITLPEGYLYLSPKAFEELNAAIKTVYAEYILRKCEVLQKFAFVLEQNYERKKRKQEEDIKEEKRRQAELKAAAEAAYKELMLRKQSELQNFAFILEQSYEKRQEALAKEEQRKQQEEQIRQQEEKRKQEKAMQEQREKEFQSALTTLKLLQAPWQEFSDTYQKIQKFAKMQALPIFIDAKELAAFENNFNEKWSSNSVGECNASLTFQTRLDHNHGNYFTEKNKLQKFDILVRLVSTACHWKESYAAIRAYGVILSTIKEEAKSQCNAIYNYFILEDWQYEHCLKEFVACVKETYKDPVCFGYFVYYLMLENKIPLPPKYERTYYNLGFEFAYNKVKQDILPYAKEFFENLEVLQLDRELTSDDQTPAITVEDFDLMSGQEFEQAIAVIFKSMGYKVSSTPITGDQGIDIIAVRNGIRIGIQAKCYTGKVGNSAVQEVVAGKQYYNLNRCMVVTNSAFTSSAVKLAKANNVTLWDRKVLQEKLLSYNN